MTARSSKKSVHFAPIVSHAAPSYIPPAALSQIPDHEKSTIWYNVDDVNAFKLSARIVALRVRQSDRQRSLDESEINSNKCSRRRSSLQHVYNRNMDKASQDIQSSCLDLGTDAVRLLWDEGNDEVSDFETYGIVPRGLELQVSFARQHRQKVGQLKFLEYQSKFKAAASSDEEGQGGIPKGYTLEDILASVLRRESQWSKDVALANGQADYGTVYPQLAPTASFTSTHRRSSLTTISEEYEPKKRQRSMPLYQSHAAAIVSDDEQMATRRTSMANVVTKTALYSKYSIQHSI